MKSYFLLPILSLAALSFAAAQRRAGPPASYPPYADPGSTPGLIFVIVVSAAFITGFVGICILHCFYGDTIGDGANEIALHAAAASRRGRLSPSGLDPAVINSFPVFKYSEIIKHLKISQGEVLLCAVCVSEFEDEETLRLLPECEHVFHPECIDLWLASQSTCPICRANLSRGTESTRECNNNSRPEVGEAPNDQNQVSITVDGNQRIFPRPHSTGHSLVRLGDERYTSDKWFCTTPPFSTGKVGVVDGDVTAVPVRTSKSSSNLNSEFGMYIPIL